MSSCTTKDKFCDVFQKYKKLNSKVRSLPKSDLCSNLSRKCKLMSIPENGLPFINISIGKMNFKCLVDTGATANFISRDSIEKIKKTRGLRIYKINKQARCANGSLVKINKGLEVFVKISNLNWKLKFLIVSKLPVSIILGNDSLIQMQAFLNFSSKNISFPFSNELIPIELMSFNETIQSNYIVDQPINLKKSDEEKLQHLYEKYSDVLTEKIGHAKNYQMSIQLKDKIPLRKSPYPLSPPKAAEMQNYLEVLLKQGVIEKCISPYASPAFIVKKKDKSPRLVVDYRQVNQHIVFDPYPSPRIEEIFQCLNGSRIFSSIDLTSAFFQVPLSEESKNITSFVVPLGQFRFTHAPQGLSVSPQLLNRIIVDIFGDLKYKFCLPYLDDLLIHSATLEEHFMHLEEVLSRLRKAGLTANPKKSIFCRTRLKFLGHVVSEAGLQLDPDKVRAINEMSPPRNIKQLRSFIGLASYFNKFIQNFAEICTPLNNLKKKGVRFKFGEEEIESFNKIKEKLMNTPILRYPDFNKEFLLRCDSSDVALGATLMQCHDDQWLPVAYASRKLTETEQRYIIYERECLALVWSVQKFKDYLMPKRFRVETDNAALSWLMKTPRSLGKTARWILTLSHFDFDIVHIGGAMNNIADCLSRLYTEENNDNEENPINSQQESLNILTEVPEAFQSLKRLQDADPFCQGIAQRINAGHDVENFDIRNGIIVKLVGKFHHRRIYVPENMRKMILYYHHDMILSAHNGVTKTYRQIAKRYYWPKLYQDVLQYVRSCQLCQQNKPSQAQKGAPMASVAPRKVWEAVHVDYLGPMSISSNRNRYCLVLIDSYSKWVEIIPTTRCTSSVTVKKLEEIWHRYGPPLRVVTDNAKNFTSRDFKDMCVRWGCKHTTTSPYNPKANNAERVNKVIVSSLAILIKQYSEKHKIWDNFVKSVCFSYNNSVCETTNVTPASLFLKRELSLPLDNLWNVNEIISSVKVPSKEKVQRFIQDSLERRRHYYNLRRPDNHPFQVGSLVLQKLIRVSVPGVTSKKFLPRWSSARRIVRFTSPVSCIVRDDETGKTFRAHIDNLKIFHPRRNN